MKIELHEIPVRDVFDGYEDNAESGVVGFGGRLDIRPAFQREFIYKDKQRDEVINTVRKDFPLNVMYWVINAAGDYELMDGQQRTISICQYLNGDFSVEYQYFHNLTAEEQQQILDYKLMVYICEGTDKEKLDWFKVINIAGEKLTDQELRNAIYTGPWLADAKKYFSKTACPAYQIASDYINGSPIRQDYLQTVLKWISVRDGVEIEEYMAKHQQDADAHELWLYFKSVIDWVTAIFPNYRREMKGLDWGRLYNKYKDTNYVPAQMEQRIVELYTDDDVTSHKGVYEYLLSGETEERLLSIRAFDNRMKRFAYESQGHKCAKCGQIFELKDMHADHITPWSRGGKTIRENCQMLCADCNRRKSDV